MKTKLTAMEGVNLRLKQDVLVQRKVQAELRKLGHPQPTWAQVAAPCPPLNLAAPPPTPPAMQGPQSGEANIAQVLIQVAQQLATLAAGLRA